LLDRSQPRRANRCGGREEYGDTEKLKPPKSRLQRQKDHGPQHVFREPATNPKHRATFAAESNARQDQAYERGRAAEQQKHPRDVVEKGRHMNEPMTFNRAAKGIAAPLLCTLVGLRHTSTTLLNPEFEQSCNARYGQAS
jgi:hypothetical protein